MEAGNNQNSNARPGFTFGRAGSMGIGRKSVRSFLPVLALVTAAGCAAYKPRPDNLEQGVPLSERFTTEIMPSDYATPAPTENRFFSVDTEALKADIRAAIAARGIAPSPLHQPVVEDLGDGVAEDIDEASTGRAHLYSFNNPEEQEQVGAKRFCASVGPHHSMDRMEYAQRLTGISQLRLKPHFPGAEAIHKTVGQHERNHCETYERFIPKWARESVADVAAVAHHYQAHGDDGFGEALGHIRNLEAFNKKSSGHYSSPALEAMFPDLRDLTDSGQKEKRQFIGEHGEDYILLDGGVLSINTHLTILEGKLLGYGPQEVREQKPAPGTLAPGV